MSYRNITCSCETPVCVQEERRGPLMFSLPHPQAHTIGDSRRLGLMWRGSAQKAFQWWLIRECILSRRGFFMGF